MGKINGRQVFWAVSISILVAVATGEHIYRRILQLRYEQAVRVQRELEIEYATVLAAYHEHTKDLTQERQRNDQLAEALTDRTTRLEQALGKLNDERRAINELETRLTSTREQLEQLQGELALALDQREPPAASAQAPDTVQLERVVISDNDGAATQGRVVSVHPEWNFVVVDLGWNLVKIGDTVSIFRNNELLAQAKVERVQERAAAATLLPAWEHAPIQVNDQVRI